MHVLVRLLLLLATPTAINASPNYGSIIISGITSVYDGDTFRANIADYPPIVGENIGIRINGIDTPEMKGKCNRESALAKFAQEHTEKTLLSAKVIELRNMKRGKYFRIVADVYVDGVNLGEQLVNQDFAVIYDGQSSRRDWCLPD
jgi:micrococcal nuclease